MAILSELEVGPDKVHLIGNEVTVFAMRAMPDWTVREFCQVPIYFQDKKYYLKRKTAGPPPYAFHYQLAPWHSGLGEESNRPISYGEAYVAHREEQFRSERRNDHLYPALLSIYPLLGLCWSRFKERVLGPRGFEPVSITEASILLVFACFMLEGVFVCYFRLGFLALVFSREWLLWVDYSLFALLPVDCIIRYGQVLRGDESPQGFLEWAFRWMRH
jgi:hypothetical protein